jgi:DNA primase
MIPREKVDEVLAATRIEEVIGEFVNLKKAGSGYRGLSPFSQEKTPSFYVLPSKQIFKDFSSGKGGTAISFLMEHEHFTFPEAIKYLARKYGIEIEETVVDEAYQAAENEREELYLANAFAQKFFTESLHNTQEGRNIGLSYFRERGFTDGIIESFKLGYCPEHETPLYKAAETAGYKPDSLLKTGLIKEKNGSYFDFFRARVMFPIFSQSGRVIAFGGRILRTDKKIAKYFNSPESEIYFKSKVLYGLFQSKQEISRRDVCYLVEGYTDVLAMHQAGIKNTVSSSGTALTKEQIRLISRCTKNVTILYDGDPAGIRASLRGIDMLLEEGLNVRVVLFPENHDPDSFSKTVSEEELRNYIEAEQKDFVAFKSSLLLADAGDDPIRRSEAIKDIIYSIAHIPDAISRSMFIKQCSQKFELNEQSLILQCNKSRKDLYQKDHPGLREQNQLIAGADVQKQLPDVQENDQSTSEPQEKEVIRLLLNYSDKLINVAFLNEKNETVYEEMNLTRYMVDEISADGMGFSNPVYQEMFNCFAEALAAGKIISAGDFYMNDNEALRNAAIDLTTSPYTMSEHWHKKHGIFTVTEQESLDRVALRTMLVFKAKKINLLLKDFRQKLKNATEAGEIDKIMEHTLQLKQAEVNVNRMLGRDVIE